MALLADLLAANRKLMEDVSYRLRVVGELGHAEVDYAIEGDRS